MNSAVLIGRLVRDPELSYIPNSQTAVCHFTLAVNRPRRNGEDQGADFLRVTVFGKQGENCDRYLEKGRQAAVHGRIQTGEYTNKDGVKVNTVEIVADNVEFLGGGQGASTKTPAAPNDAQFGADNAGGAPVQMPQADVPDSFQAAEDDIPF